MKPSHVTANVDWSRDLKPGPGTDGAEILKYERQRSSINVNALSEHLFGRTYLERVQRITGILQREKIFSKANQQNLSRPDRYKLGLARGKRMRQLMDEHGWDDDDLLMAEYLIDDIQPYHLHMSLFAAAMKEQCSEEQRRYWLPKIASWEIIGAYAQTELGHGSNVRGIECEARWDPATKEFVMHSPTLTASKWWNGTLGRTATHSVVVAQLMLPIGKLANGDTKYESKGPRPFIIEIRDAKTHLPPESIIVGDINAKYGYAPMDNAYCLFRNHRVPHSALLSRYASVDPNTGVYSRPKNPSSVYGQLTRGRAFIVLNARLVIARAVTVAVRYLAIRRQFREQDANDASSLETPVLDYATVQIRILPLLATAFALHYSGSAMWALYERTRAQNSLDSDNAQLAELHTTSAGLKSLATDLAANSVETCRRAMGGHGFGGGTGLIQLNNDYLSKPTVEGDNWMITQQVARFLIKKVKELSSASDGTANSQTEKNLKAYLAQKNSPPKISALDDGGEIVQAFRWRASWLAFKAYEVREVQKKPMNRLLITLHKLSRGEYWTCFSIHS
jgi:acyl-CoA oxidase